MDRIVGLLMQHTPEIICFQEANIKMLDILQGRLQHYGFTKFIQNITNDTYTFNFFQSLVSFRISIANSSIVNTV